MNIIDKLKVAVGAPVAIAIQISWLVGYFYWAWMSIQLGSVWMYIWGTSTLILVAPFVGVYALFFGVPDWVVYLWG